MQEKVAQDVQHQKKKIVNQRGLTSQRLVAALNGTPATVNWSAAAAHPQIHPLSSHFKEAAF